MEIVIGFHPMTSKQQSPNLDLTFRYFILKMVADKADETFRFAKSFEIVTG